MISILTRRLLPLAPALLLFGCASAPSLSGYAMTLASEDCRAAAIAQAATPGAGKTPTADEKLAAFDRAYRACMAARGY